MRHKRAGSEVYAGKWAWLGFLAPSLLGVLIFVCLPFLDVVRRSFTTAVTGRWTGLSNYKSVFENEAFRLAVWNTFRFTAVCLPLLVGLGLHPAPSGYTQRITGRCMGERFCQDCRPLQAGTLGSTPPLR